MVSVVFILEGERDKTMDAFDDKYIAMDVEMEKLGIPRGKWEKKFAKLDDEERKAMDEWKVRRNELDALLSWG